mmetsp:Transcript_49395/g.138951  ORF Transcript_49395/g.138951 Transcript_49395/m.138951 type:complete len:214 (-) Transcript_49395:417-1058(-)
MHQGGCQGLLLACRAPLPRGAGARLRRQQRPAQQLGRRGPRQGRAGLDLVQRDVARGLPELQRGGEAHHEPRDVLHRQLRRGPAVHRPERPGQGPPLGAGVRAPRHVAGPHWPLRRAPQLGGGHPGAVLHFGARYAGRQLGRRRLRLLLREPRLQGVRGGRRGRPRVVHRAAEERVRYLRRPGRPLVAHRGAAPAQRHSADARRRRFLHHAPR